MVTCLSTFPRAESQVKRLTCDLFYIVLGSMFLALVSQVQFYLWFSPVPLSLQTLGVLLIAGLLGSKRATLSVMTYLAEGAFGLPFFAGGSFGVAKLFGPTGGYLLSFILTAFVVGYLLERGWKNRSDLTLLALAIGSTLTLSLGTLWLAQFIGLSHAFFAGFALFIPGAILKVLAATLLLPFGRKLLPTP